MVNPNYSCSSVSPDRQPGENNQVKYKGVRLRKWGKWVSEIRLPNCRERIWLGSYDSAEKAARAFDAAQFCLRGRNANFNFIDSPSNINLPTGRPAGLTPAEIQEIATRYANNFNDHEQQQTNGNVDNDLGVQATMAVLTNSDCTLDDWPLSYYDDNIIYEPNINIVPNHHHQEDIVASSGVPTSSVNGGVPDYNNLFMSSLDQYMHEDIYMAPYLGNRFCDGSQDEQQIIDVDQHHYYSQESFLWNF